jgi:hypothetical protein
MVTRVELVNVTNYTTAQLVNLMRRYRQLGNGRARIEAQPGTQHPMVRGVEWTDGDVPPGYLRVVVA